MIKATRHSSFTIFLVVLGLLIFLHILGVLRPLENFLIYLSKPIGGQMYSQGTSFNFSYKEQRDKESLLNKIDELNKEVERLSLVNSALQGAEEENQKLRELLQFNKQNQFKTVLAQVIAKESLSDINEGEKDIIINKGRKDGLEKGLALVSETGAIVGKILSLKDHLARACLITSRDCRLAAAIQNEGQTVGLTEGDLGLTVKMDYIPQSEKLSLNDVVITSGLGEKIPRGLVIGKITMINSESNEVWQSATINPLVNFNNLNLLSVVLP